MAAVHSASPQVRPPPLTQSDAVTSLLGLAAGNDNPAPISISSATSTSSISSSTFTGTLGLSQTTTTTGTSLGSSSPITGTTSGGNGKHHRRLGSTGKTRRRLSDAREASTRPLTQHSLLSMASLSLSTSPALSSKPLAPRPTASGISISGNSTTPTAIPVTSVSETTVKPESSDNDPVAFSKTSSGGSTPIPITANGRQKKRGIDYKCESCAKIYRHPNCLNKHRWEHTRQWREASKFVLSKHQQVQLLEAATILSYMGAPSASLPEDRSEWPSFLSGGSLPKVELVGSSREKTSSVSFGPVNNGNIAGNGPPKALMTTQPTRSNALPLSTSVPVRMSASGSHGPRMHDFALPSSTSAGVGIGVVGPSPNSLAQGRSTGNRTNFPATSNAGGPLMQPLTPPLAANHIMTMDQPGWTSHIPSSSIRSESSASGSGSRSRSGSLSGSRSRSRSDGSELEPEIEEEEHIDVDVEIMDADADTGEDEKAFGVPDATTKGYPVSVVSSRPTERLPVPYHVGVGAYPHGSYGSSYGGHGVARGGGEYGSYSSYGTANADLGTSGFGGFSNRAYGHGSGPYASAINTKPTEHYGNNNDYSSASRALRSSSTISQRRDEGMSMRPIVDAEETMTRNANDHVYERRWDGMEMEVDMDMD